MRTLHMLHPLEVQPGDYTSTVRNGFKWADLQVQEQIELCVCLPTRDDHSVVGTGRVIELWFGRFSEIPARLIANEHEVRARTYFGLFDSMKKAYGNTFFESSPVTVVRYQRIS